jgi:hypothetical protein
MLTLDPYPEESDLEYEGARVTGDVILVIMEDITLCHVTVGTVFC